MPHCIIEHSQTIDAEALMPLVYSGALQSQLFKADGSDIKVRALPYVACQAGGQQSDFIHVMLRILSGRTAEQKKNLSRLVLSELDSTGISHSSVTVEVVDIDRDSYSKSNLS